MARDHFHSAVRNALIKDGWTITDDPLRVSYGLSNMEIDLGAENLVAAQKDLQKIAVEIKSFLGSSALSEFHVAFGQCLNYRLALQLVALTAVFFWRFLMKPMKLSSVKLLLRRPSTGINSRS